MSGKKRRCAVWLWGLGLLGVPLIVCAEETPTGLPTTKPSPLPSLPQTAVPTLVPSNICNESACVIVDGDTETVDSTCCSRRDQGAFCASGFEYSRGEVCETLRIPGEGTEDLYKTCCTPLLSSSSSDSDGLTKGEELAIALTFSIVFGGLLLCCVRGAYYFVVGGCRYPDLGAVGSTVWYDERRGQCFGLIAFFTLFNLFTLVAAWLAAGEDADMLEIFAFARLQTTDSDTFLVIGLNGYGIFASETGNGEYNTFDSNYGKDSEVGDRSDFDWTGECKTAGEQAQDILIVVALLKLICSFFIYRRQNPNTDSAFVKLLAAFFELWCGLLIVGCVVAWALRCLAELPTGSIFLPDVDASYAYDSIETGDDYKIAAAAPYSSYFCLIFSSLFSFYVAWVHWRTPTWGAELVEKDYY
mmetsp:Transcript_2625/g.8190  ORF Transcript_2625/g.8190 Transcript_2625/m.8190 type:complete len:415 (+) Transcript_2625:46-1290(+)